MNKKIIIIGLVIASFFGGLVFSKTIDNNDSSTLNEQLSKDTEMTENDKNMEKSNIKLGAFSMSLSVKDLKVSKAFYEKMGFTVNGGGMEMNYLIMKNENALIGLFQGMFEGNILTFNPGWNENAKNIATFDDVRVIQNHLKENAVELMTEAADSTTGPASIMLADPDGNLILIDQHR